MTESMATRVTPDDEYEQEFLEARDALERAICDTIERWLKSGMIPEPMAIEDFLQKSVAKELSRWFPEE